MKAFLYILLFTIGNLNIVHSQNINDLATFNSVKSKHLDTESLLKDFKLSPNNGTAIVDFGSKHDTLNYKRLYQKGKFSLSDDYIDKKIILLNNSKGYQQGTFKSIKGNIAEIVAGNERVIKVDLFKYDYFLSEIE